jgi:hypothetical protein
MKNYHRFWKTGHALLVGISIIFGMTASSQTVASEDKTDAYRWGMVHPVDYWWEFEPSQVGIWDYFSPVKHRYEPLPVLVKERVDKVVSRPMAMAPVQQVITPPPTNTAVIYSSTPPQRPIGACGAPCGTL